jgi:hypothetical protein
VLALLLLMAGIVAAGLLLPRGTEPRTLLVTRVENQTARSGYDGLARSLDTVVLDRAVRFPGVRVVQEAERGGIGNAVTLRSRLIIRNGAPELAMTVTDAATGTVLWSSFASGASGNMVQVVAGRLDALAPRIGASRDTSS